MSNLVFLLVSLGLTFIVTKSTIFEPFRNLFKRNSDEGQSFLFVLFSCAQCFGFWSGVFLNFFFQSISASYLPETVFVEYFFKYLFDGCITSFVCYFAANLLYYFDYLEAKHEFYDTHSDYLVEDAKRIQLEIREKLDNISLD